MTADAVEKVLVEIFKDLASSAARVEVADSLSNAFIVALASHATRKNSTKAAASKSVEVDTTRPVLLLT